MATNNTAFTTPNFRRAAVDPMVKPEDEEFDITKSPLFKQSSQLAANQMIGETPAFETQANIGREAFKVAQAQKAKATRESLMNLGLRNTGTYATEGFVRPAEEELRGRMDLERQMAVERENLMQERQAQGQTAAQGLLGQQEGQETTQAQIASTEKLAFADIGSRESIASMQNDTEKWKTTRAEDLTKQGWSHEDAMQQAGFEQQSMQANLDRELQKEIEEGRLTLQEKDLALKATQFNDKLSFDRWATEQGFSEAEKQRAWQSGENSLTRTQEATLAKEAQTFQRETLGIQQTFEAGQSALDRELQKDIEAGRMTLEDKKLALQATQFNDELSFKKWAQQQNIDSETANRVWQSGENALTRTHQALMQDLEQKFQAKGMNFTAIMSNLENYEPEQARAILDNIAADAGIVIPNYTEPTTAEKTIGTVEAPVHTFLQPTGDFGSVVKEGQYVSFENPEGLGSKDTAYNIVIPNGKYVVKKLPLNPRLGLRDVENILYYENVDTGEKYIAKKNVDGGHAQNVYLRDTYGIQ